MGRGEDDRRGKERMRGQMREREKGLFLVRVCVIIFGVVSRLRRCVKIFFFSFSFPDIERARKGVWF